jgi:tRNA(Arg) A34 adenosine deaminase TadA
MVPPNAIGHTGGAFVQEGPLRLVATRIRSEIPGPFAFWHSDADEKNIYCSWATTEANKPYSATVNLLQGLYTRWNKLPPGTVYRSTDARFTEMCMGMADFCETKVHPVPVNVIPGIEHISQNAFIKTRTFTGLNPDVLKTRDIPTVLDLNKLKESPRLDLRSQDPRNSAVHRLYMMMAMALVGKNFNTNKGHNIAAMLVDNEGVILEVTLNSVNLNHTFHAEVNLLQKYFKTAQVLPPGATIYTTLKPCRMCAGMFAELMANRPDVAIIYGQNDPGAHATNTALDRQFRDQQISIDTIKRIRLRQESYWSPPEKPKSGWVHGNMTWYLHLERAKAMNVDHIYSLVAFLKTPAAADAFKFTERGLRRKLHKYSLADEYGGTLVDPNENVWAVIDHASELLRELASE